jgi:exopolysaccharide biosynthesis polyprenyl glycosylphosphotransferase
LTEPPRADVKPPVVGDISQLEQTLTDNPVDEVFVVGGVETIASLAPTAQALVERGRTVSLITPLVSSRHAVRGRVTEFSGVPMISFGPMPHDEVGSSLKRALDFTLAACGLLIAAPLLLLVGLMIKLLDPGPVLFSQERLGRNGERFRLYKFRSMRTDAEGRLKADPGLYRRYLENDYKLPDDEDPRISRLGRLLRRTSLDELPQLWNILRGDMSVVGPRPIVPDEISLYEPYADMLLSTRPGLTGHWQVNGRSDIKYPERAFLDLDYIGSNSIASDLSIIVKTFPAVVRRKGAY